MPFGQQPVVALQAGLAPTPPVAPVAPTSTDAVAQLVDQYRNGAITAADIKARSNKNLVETQAAQEFVSPEQKQARLDQAVAAGAQAQLQTSQANAQQQLVQPAVSFQKAKFNREHADLLAKESMDAFLHFNGPIYDEEGQPDYKAMATAGVQYVRGGYFMGLAQQGLTPTQTINKTNENGSISTIYLNSRGENITPGTESDPTSPRARYFNMWTQVPVGMTGGWTPQKAMEAVPSHAPTNIAAPSAAAPQLVPLPQAGPAVSDPTEPPVVPGVYDHSVDAQRRAQLVNSGIASPTEAANATPDQINAALALPTQPQAAVTLPVAPQVTVRTPAGVFDPVTSSIQTKAPEGQFATPKDIVEDLHKQKSYEAWDTQKGYLETFDRTAKDIAKIPDEAQRSGRVNMNTLDAGLAESIIKLYDPQGAIREFKWDKLTSPEKNSILERLPNAVSSLLGSATLTPEGRRRLIQMGYEVADAKEAAVRPFLQQAEARVNTHGVNKALVFTPEENRVLAGVPFGGPGRMTTHGQEALSPGNAAANAAGAIGAAVNGNNGVPPGARLTKFKGEPGYIIGSRFYPLK